MGNIFAVVNNGTLKVLGTKDIRGSELVLLTEQHHKINFTFLGKFLDISVFY